MTNDLMLGKSRLSLMPILRSSGCRLVLIWSSSTGNWSRIRGSSLTKIGTIISTRPSASSTNSSSTSSTASTRGTRPWKAASSRSTSGVSA